MNTRLIKTLQQVEERLQQASDIESGWESKDECYQWVETTLRHLRNPSPSRADEGINQTLPTGCDRLLQSLGIPADQDLHRHR